MKHNLACVTAVAMALLTPVIASADDCGRHRDSHRARYTSDPRGTYTSIVIDGIGRYDHYDGQGRYDRSDRYDSRWRDDDRRDDRWDDRDRDDRRFRNRHDNGRHLGWYKDRDRCDDRRR